MLVSSPRHLPLIAASLLAFSSIASAVIEIDAKAVKTSSSKTEELWVIRFCLENTAGNASGPLKLQYRYSGHSEFDEDGKPEGSLQHTEGSLDSPSLPARGKTTVETKEMNFAGDQETRIRVKDLYQDIRVRAWSNGKLVGEFPKNGGKGGKSEWPLSPPPVPTGAEAGPGPWLLIADGRAEFSGISLGASASQVLTLLQSQGTTKPTAKQEPFLTHPFRMTTADLPGCLFAFDAAKKLSAIEITDATRAKLPGGLVLGKSTLADFAKSLGPSEPIEPAPDGASAGRRFKLGNATLTVRDQTEAPGTAAAILLEGQSP